MSSSAEIFNIMASDIGVFRFGGEDEESFCHRTAYSAARFWVSAFCLDDGADGKEGLSKQAINRRLKSWIADLDKLQPGMANWFAIESDGLPSVYNRLIDVGEIAVNGFNGTYLATSASEQAVSRDRSCITGFYDPTTASKMVCGHRIGDTAVSGLTTIVDAHNEEIERRNPWWVSDLGYMRWERAANFEEVRYADAHSLRWNVNRSDVWTEVPDWSNGIALARVEGTGVDPVLYAARKAKRGPEISPITWNQAQELFFHLREACGNKAVARYIRLDEKHVKMVSPVGFIPGNLNKVLDALGWPVDDVNDRFNRIMRAEALPLVEELLEASSIGLGVVKNG